MCVSHKSISWKLLLSKNVIISQSKASTEKWTLFFVLSNLWHIKNNVFSFQRNLRLSQKHFIKFSCFQRTWLSFKIKLLQRKGTLFSLLTVLWHVPNRRFYFESNRCAFLTIAFHEIHWLSNDRDYLSK